MIFHIKWFNRAITGLVFVLDDYILSKQHNNFHFELFIGNINKLLSVL